MTRLSLQEAYELVAEEMGEECAAPTRAGEKAVPYVAKISMRGQQPRDFTELLYYAQADRTAVYDSISKAYPEDGDDDGFSIAGVRAWQYFHGGLGKKKRALPDEACAMIDGRILVFMIRPTTARILGRVMGDSVMGVMPLAKLPAAWRIDNEFVKRIETVARCFPSNRPAEEQFRLQQ